MFYKHNKSAALEYALTIAIAYLNAEEKISVFKLLHCVKILSFYPKSRAYFCITIAVALSALRGELPNLETKGLVITNIRVVHYCINLRSSDWEACFKCRDTERTV